MKNKKQDKWGIPHLRGALKEEDNVEIRPMEEVLISLGVI
jgi:hypothetical protein